MALDPNCPPTNALLESAPLCDQFNSLKQLGDASQAGLTQLQMQMADHNACARSPSHGRISCPMRPMVCARRAQQAIKQRIDNDKSINILSLPVVPR